MKARFVKSRLSKDKIIKELLKDYKTEYKKNYWNNRYVGLNGIFDNKLFCDIIRKRIGYIWYKMPL